MPLCYPQGMTRRSQQAQRRPDNRPRAPFWVAMLAYLVTLIDRLLLALLTSWPVMMLLGAVHSQIPQVPAFGYWATLLILATLALVSILTTSISQDTELRIQKMFDQAAGAGQNSQPHTWASLPPAGQ